MKRGTWILLGAAVSASACSTIFGDEVFTEVATGGADGGGTLTTTSTATSTSTSTSTGTITGCSSNADCPTGFGCSSASTCLLLEGQSCAMPTDCVSNFCVDGVCCNSACDTTCQACSAALTGGTNGKCASATDSTVDPRGLCIKTAVATCGTDGKCFGGACADWSSNTVCGTNACDGNVTPSYVYLMFCNTPGHCVPSQTKVNCPVFSCATTGMACGCSVGTDCPPLTPTCTNHACVP